jgi:hypothetical protein
MTREHEQWAIKERRFFFSYKELHSNLKVTNYSTHHAFPLLQTKALLTQRLCILLVQ